MNYALLAANVAVYFFGYNAASDAGSRRVFSFMLHPDAPRLVQFFSSMFLHGSIVHLLGNMVFLWVFGNAVNDRFGQAGYLAFYLAGGVLAGVGYVLLAGSQPVVGASGAIAAVTGAYLVLLPRSHVTVLALLVFVLMPFEISSLYFIMFQVLVNLAMTVFAWGGKYTAGGGIAYAAHSTGYLFGILVAAGLLATRILPRDAYDMLNLFGAYRRRQRYRKMASEGYDPFSPVGSGLKGVADSQSVEQVAPDSPAARESMLRRRISESFARNDLAAAASGYRDLVQLADAPVLSQQQQLDVANYLMADEQYASAADAYQKFLSHYGQYKHLADIYLMLGLLYGRYLHQYDQAENCLGRAIEMLDDPRKLELARSDLADVRRARSK